MGEIIIDAVASKRYRIFIKVGEYQFMERLFRKGEVFCKPLQYFRTEEQVSLRHDKNEGARLIKQIQRIKLSDPKTRKTLRFSDSGQMYIHDNNDKGNIYCLYGVETNTLDLIPHAIKSFNIDMDGLNFGDTAIVIFDPSEFINRVRLEVERIGLSFRLSPVTYYDQRHHDGHLSPFHKSKIFSPQNEVRFWISNDLDKDLTFLIGDISDIAMILPKDEISTLGYSNV